MKSRELAENKKVLDKKLKINQNFDIINRNVVIGERKAIFYLVDGFTKDEVFEKLAEFFYGLDASALASPTQLLETGVPYCETALEWDENAIITAILSGQTALLVDGFDCAVLLDIRTYPQRDTAEPEKDKTFRGARDGFVETVVLNCALIRRRIRSPQLCMEAISVGNTSKTDIILCYMENRVDAKLLSLLKQKLQKAQIDALTMNPESVTEILQPRKWYCVLPKFKYTERPDTTAAQILEGDIAILMDNAPSVLLLPCSIFDIMEEANDYYFPPLTGTYLRMTRFVMLFIMLLLTPIWLLQVQNPQWLPEGLRFVLPQETPFVPLILQLLLLEFGIDGLKLAALNTPDMLTTALSVIAGIVVGDFAVQSGWFSAEPLLYMAVVAIGSYNQPSWELTYAFKFMRIFLLLMVYFANLWGFVIGVLLIFARLIFTKTFSGKGYLYPLLPFDGKVLYRKLFRPSIYKQ